MVILLSENRQKKEKLLYRSRNWYDASAWRNTSTNTFLVLKNFRKYNSDKDSAKDSGIIGHFGLGFYSAFMVASK
jgi:hypothetical protein